MTLIIGFCSICGRPILPDDPYDWDDASYWHAACDDDDLDQPAATSVTMGEGGDDG